VFQEVVLPLLLDGLSRALGVGSHGTLRVQAGLHLAASCRLVLGPLVLEALREVKDWALLVVNFLGSLTQL